MLYCLILYVYIMKSALKFSLLVFTVVSSSLFLMYKLAPRGEVRAYDPDLFVTVWKTDNTEVGSTDSKSVKLPMKAHGYLKHDHLNYYML